EEVRGVHRREGPLRARHRRRRQRGDRPLHRRPQHRRGAGERAGAGSPSRVVLIVLNIARRCVPFTPFEKDLATATVALVSATGVYAPGQQPFPTEYPSDITFRAIEAAPESSALKIPHHHYDHSEADGDPNIVFPLDTLRELARDGFISAMNDKHYSSGFTTRLRELYETTFPEL